MQDCEKCSKNSYDGIATQLVIIFCLHSNLTEVWERTYFEAYFLDEFDVSKKLLKLYHIAQICFILIMRALLFLKSCVPTFFRHTSLLFG